MTISQEVRLVDDVSGPAQSAAAAVQALVKQLGGLDGAGSKGGNAAEVATIKATMQAQKDASAAALADQKASAAAEAAATKTAAAEKSAAIKGAIAEQLAAQKAAAAAAAADSKAQAALQQTDAAAAAQFQLAQQKATISAVLAAQKAASAERLAEIKAEQAAEANESKVRIAEIKAEVAAKKDEAKASAGSVGVGVEDQAPEESGGAASSSAISSALTDLAIEAKVIDLAKQAAQAAEQLVVAGAKMSIDATTFKDNTVLGFQQFVKSNAEATKLYGEALDLADRIGQDKGDVVAKIKALMTSGLGEQEALGAIQAQADLAQVKGESAADAFTKLIEKVQAKGKFDKAAMSGLAKQGIATEDVYKALEKQTGKTKEQVDAMIKAGTISAADGIKALETAVEGKIGGIAEKASQTVPRLLATLSDTFERLFDGVDWGPLKNGILSVIDVLKGPEGQKLKDSFNVLFGSIAKLFDFKKGDISSVVDSIANAIHGVGDAVNMIGPSVKGFFSGLADAGGASLGIIGDIVSGLSAVLGGNNADTWKTIGEAIGYTAGAIGILSAAIAALFVAPIIAVAEALGWLWDEVSGFFSNISGTGPAIVAAISETFTNAYNAVAGFAGQMVQAGENLINGLVQGIEHGASAVVASITSVATNAIAAAKAALGIASPSKEFHSIGENLPTSMGAATDRHSGRAIDAAASLASDATQAANDNAGSASIDVGVNGPGRAVDAVAALKSGAANNDNAKPWGGAGASGGGKAGATAGAPTGGTSGPVTIQVTIQNVPGSPQEAKQLGQVIGDEAARAYIRRISTGG